jgi:23S rRNA pseudouridine2605 synthase
MQERIQKILSNAGITSRRNAELWIQGGRITVNDKAVHLGDKADPEKDVIKLDEERLNLKTKRIYIAFYKPRFYVVSTVPEPGKKSIFEIPSLADLTQRVYPVGRLDYDTEGLLLLTNDGDFANKVMHPRYEQEKTYQAKTKEPLIDNSIKHINQGVNVMGRKVMAKAKIINREQHLVEITLHEGRKHIVKKLLFKLGYLVKALKRVKVGNISLGNLKPGECRILNESEISQLKGK